MKFLCLPRISSIQFNGVDCHLFYVDEDCIIIEEEEETNASVEEQPQSSYSKRKQIRGTKELEKFGDEVDSDENNLYDYDDNYVENTNEDPELTQLRVEYEGSLPTKAYEMSQYIDPPASFTPSNNEPHQSGRRVRTTPSTHIFQNNPSFTEPIQQQTNTSRTTPSITQPLQQQNERLIHNTPSITKPLQKQNERLVHNTPSIT